MGLPMAENLVKAGHAVVGFDLTPAAVEQLVAANGTAASSTAEACKGAEIVITMLPAGAHVREVYLAEGGVLASVQGALLIDCSTIDVETAREAASAARVYELLMVDAPVSGGVAGAKAGTLTFMVGGSDAAFERAKPILEGMGRT